MPLLQTLTVKIESQIGGLTRGLRQAKRETERSVRAMRDAFRQGRAQGPDVMAAGAKRLGQAMGALTNPVTLAAGAVAGLATGLAASTRAAADFERSFINVASLGANSAEQLELMRRGLLRLAPAVGEGPEALSDALYDIVSAGQSGQDALDVLKASAIAAKAGLTDTKTAADLVTTALNAYGMEASEAARVTDIVQTAVKLGKTTWSELGGALGRVIPTAASVGIGMDEVAAAVASLTSQGIRTNEAVTGLKAALSNIIRPSQQAADLAMDLGIEFDAQALKAHGLAGVLAEVKEKTGGNTEQMAALFGSVEALNTVLALTSDSGSQKMIEAQAAMQDSAGATEDAFKTQAATFDQTKQRFAAAVASIKIQVGSVLLPALTTLLNWFTTSIATIQGWYDTITGFFRGLSQGGGETTSSVKAAFVSFAQVLTAIFNDLVALWNNVLKPVWAAIEPFVQGLLRALSTLFDGFFKTLDHLFKAFAAFLSGDWRKAWEEMRTALQTIFKTLAKALGQIVDGLRKTLVQVLDAIKNKFAAVGNWLKTTWKTAWTTAITAVKTLMAGLQTALGGRIDSIRGTFSALTQWIGTTWRSVWDSGLSAIRGLVVALSNSISRIAGEIQEGLDALGQWLSDTWVTLWENAKELILGLLGNLQSEALRISDAIRDGIQGAWNALTEFLNGTVKAAFMTFKSSIVDIMQALADGVGRAIGGLGTVVGRVWDDIKNGVRSALNAAISIVNRFISALNSISIHIPEVEIPGVGSVGGGTIGFNIPTIPELAAGGIVTQPTLAVIGEAGPEAVIPLARGNYARDAIQPLPGGADAAPVINITIEGSVYGIDDLERALAQIMERKRYRLTGGV